MTGKQRLKVLANYLRSGAVDDQKFDMAFWPQCAIGEGTHLPSLQKEGLSLELDQWGDKVPHYEGFTGFEACRRFFKVSMTRAEDFFGGEPLTAVQVSNKILKYLNLK